MPWMSEPNNEPSTENVFVQYPNKLSQPGDKTEVRIRVLAGDPNDPGAPAGVWVHWVDQKPYNCARPDGRCALCEVRSELMKVNPELARKQHPMRTKSFFNVLTTENGKPVVKVFHFGHSVSKDLKEFAEKYGDLRKYDVTVRKTRVGKLEMNVDYSCFFEGYRDLSEDELAVAANLHDLKSYVQPGDPDVIAAAARGEESAPATMEEDKVSSLIKQIRTRLPKDIDLRHFGIDENNPQISKLEALLTSLGSD